MLRGFLDAEWRKEGVVEEVAGDLQQSRLVRGGKEGLEGLTEQGVGQDRGQTVDVGFKYSEFGGEKDFLETVLHA